jgi:hypothetical protein
MGECAIATNLCRLQVGVGGAWVNVYHYANIQVGLGLGLGLGGAGRMHALYKHTG